MPNWKKLIVSGSDATLNSLNVITSISGSIISGSGIVSGVTGSFGSSGANGSVLLTDTGAESRITALNNHLSLRTQRDDDDIKFYVGDSTSLKAILEGNTGRLGIGTSSPSTKLTVVSTANEDGIALKESSGNLKFKVRPYGGNTYLSLWDSSNTENVRITSNTTSYFNGGKVGIGTTSPAVTLEIVSASSAAGTSFRITSAYGESPKKIEFVSTSNNASGNVIADILGFGRRTTPITGASPQGGPYLGFRVWDQVNSSLDEVARFTTSGSLGIGVTNPTEKLQVDGSIHASGSGSEIITDQIFRAAQGTLRFRKSTNTWDAMSMSSNGKLELASGGANDRGELVLVADYGATPRAGVIQFQNESQGSSFLFTDTNKRLKFHTSDPGEDDSLGEKVFYNNFPDTATFGGSINSGNDITAPGDLSVRDITATGGDITLGTDSIASNINAVGDVLAFKVDSNENTGGTPNLQFKVGSATELTINGSTATFASSITIPEYILHTGDGNTYFGFGGADDFRVGVGGTKRLNVHTGGVEIAGNLTGATNATFSGNVSATRFQGTTYPYNTVIGHTANATTTYIEAGSTSKTSIELSGGDVNSNIKFITPNASNVETLALTIDTSQNATFAGDVTVDNKLNFTGTSYQISGGSSVGDMRFVAPRFRFYEDSISGTAKLEIDGGNATFAGNVTVAGTLTAQEFKTELVSASIVFESGSTIFGNSSDDTHDFTGSANISSNLTVANNTTTNLLYTDNIQTRNGTVIDFRHQDASVIMRVDTDDARVGIGALTPTHKLTVNSGATNVVAKFKSSDNQAWISVQDDDSGTYGALFGTDTDSGEDIVIANKDATKRFSIDSNGKTKLHAYGSGNHTGTLAKSLGVDSSGNIIEFTGGAGGGTVSAITNGADNRIATFTGADSLNGEANLTFDGDIFAVNTNNLYVSASKVGIGTTTPDTTLEVVKNVDNSTNTSLNENATQILHNGNASGTAVLKLRGTGSNSGAIVFGGGLGASTDKFNIISRYNNTKILTAGANGNVGIGTTSPSVPLEINGVNTTSGNGEGLRITRPNLSSQYISINEADGSKHRIQAVGDKPLLISNSASNFGIQFHLSGSEKVRFTPAGNVGIGTTNPERTLDVKTSLRVGGTDAALDVSNADFIAKLGDIGGAGDGTLFTVDDTNQKFIFATGKVGIGVTSPSYQLDVTGDSTSGVIAVRNGANGRDTLRSENAAGTRTLNIGNDGNGHGLLIIRNSSGTTTNYIPGSGHSYFTSGNVGIGTTAPDRDLHVQTGADQIAKFESTDASGKIEIKDSTTSAYINANSGNASFGPFSSYSDTGNIRILSGSVGHTGNGVAAFGTSPNSNTKWKVGATVNTSADSGFNNTSIDLNVQGSTAISSDRTYRGLFIDIDSSATGGDTSNEVRLVGNYITVNDTGDADLIEGVSTITVTQMSDASGQVSNIRGIYGSAKASNSAGLVSNLIGIQGNANMGSTTGGDINTVYGMYSTVTGGNTNKTPSSVYGGFFKIDPGANFASSFGTSRGVYSEIEIDGNTTTTNLRAIEGIIDLNSGSHDTLYQLKLDTQIHASASQTGGNYGIMSTGADRHFLQGKTLLGSNNAGAPGAELHIYSTGSGLVGISIQNGTTGFDNNISDDGLSIGVNGNDAYFFSRESGDMYLAVNDSAVNGITIKSGGNVGIGNTSPGYQLDVGGDINTSTGLIRRGGNAIIKSSGAETMIGPGGSGVITFHNSSTMTSSDEKVRIDANGNLLLNNTSAGARLDIREDSNYALRLEDASGHYFRVNTGGDTEIRGNVTVGGTITAQEFHTELVSASIVFESGSTIFGNSSDDTHAFTGSVNIKDGDILVSTTGGYFQVDTSDNSTKHADNTKAKFGTGNDFQIWHDGSNTYLSNEGVGNLNIQNTADDKDIVFKSDNGSGGTEEYFKVDGSSRSIVVSAALGVYHNDGIASRFGNDGDMHLYHDGTNSVINNTTGHLQIYNNADDGDIQFISDNGSGGTAEYFRVDGGADKVIFSKGIRLIDNQRLDVGGSTDGRFYHDGTNTQLVTITGNLLIKNSNDDGDIKFFSDNGSGGETEYFRLDGGLGYSVASKHIQMTDGQAFYAGSGNDLGIFHNGTNSYLQSINGHIVIEQLADDKDIVFNSDDGSGGVAEYLKIDGGAGYTIASKDINVVDSVGISFGTGIDAFFKHSGAEFNFFNDTGNIVFNQRANDADILFKSDDGSGGLAEYLRIDGSAHTVNVGKNLVFNADDTKIRFGASNDFELYHSSTSQSYIVNKTGHLTIQNDADDKDIIFRSDNGSGATQTYLLLDGSSKSLTVGDGINVNYDNISTGNSGTVVRGGFLNPAAEANMVHLPHIINDLAGFNKWSNGTITTSGFYKSRGGSAGSYSYSNEVAANDSGWANAFDAHSSTAGSWYSDNGTDGTFTSGSDTPGVVTLEWPNEAQYSLWAGIVFGSTSFTATYVKIEAYRGGAWQTLCEVTDNTDQVVLRQVGSNSGTGQATTKLRYTLGGSVNGNYFRIHSLYMANYRAGDNNLNNTGYDVTRGVNFIEKYKNGYLHGNFYPGADNTYDLGSSNYAWKDAYFESNIILNGTGRIQGIDTVTSSTDAASKGYVDTQISNINASNIDGSGTATYIAKFSDGNTIGSSGMFQSAGGNFSIGITTPNAKLSVQDSLSIGTSATDVLKLHNESGVGTIDGYSTRNIAFGSVTNGEVMRIDNTNGRVGIGTTSPDTSLELFKEQDGDYLGLKISKLHSNGNEYTTEYGNNQLKFSGNQNYNLYNDSNKVADFHNAHTKIYGNGGVLKMNISGSGEVTIGALSSGATGALIVNQEGGVTPVAKFMTRTNKAIVQVSDNDTTGYISSENGYFSLGRNAGVNANNINIDNSNRVGIGTSSPVASLHVASTTSDYVAKFSHSTSTGYAPGSILLEAGQSDSRGQGIFHYNVEADDSWFTGVPYAVNSTKWIVAHTAQTTFNPDVAQTTHAILTIDSSNDETTFAGNVITLGGLTIGDSNADTAQIGLKHLLGYCENTDVDTGTEDIKSLPLATYQAVFFDYVVKNGTNLRAGTVTAVHDGTNVEFTDTSTKDLGDTSGVTLSVDISGSNMRLRATTTSDNWIVKANIRGIKV